MKLYKRIMKSFGGAGLYMDKSMLNHLGVLPGDEVVIELVDDKIVIKRPELDLDKIQELINGKIKARN